MEDFESRVEKLNKNIRPSITKEEIEGLVYSLGLYGMIKDVLGP